jgi:hypothetical protein
MRKLVVSLTSGAVFAAGLAIALIAAVPCPASAVMPQNVSLAPSSVILAGPRYLYGSQYYPPYRYYRQHNGDAPYYPGYRRYRPYYAPLSICGTLLCYRPKYFIAPLW